METDGTWLLADFDHDGIPDLVFIKTANCATNSVEVHVASGKSNYQTRILETGTTFAMETDGTWLMADFDGDGIPDLIFIKTANCGTNTVEVHIASSSSGYKTRILETGTTFAMETDGTWIMNDFQGNKTLDLIFLKTANCGTNTVEVHVSPQVPA
jgi:predicted nuclease of predicted toxin-antitoxin system